MLRCLICRGRDSLTSWQASKSERIARGVRRTSILNSVVIGDEAAIQDSQVSVNTASQGEAADSTLRLSARTYKSAMRWTAGENKIRTVCSDWYLRPRCAKNAHMLLCYRD